MYWLRFIILYELCVYTVLDIALVLDWFWVGTVPKGYLT